MLDIRGKLAALLEAGAPAVEPFRGQELVIYGAGGCGRDVAAAACARGIAVRLFIDARAASMPQVDGVPCHLPGSSDVRAAAEAGLPVVLAVFNYATNLQPILATLREVGFERVLTFYEIHEQFGLEPQFWLGRRSSYAEHAQDVVAGFDLFADALSQQVYYEQIALRLTFDTSLLGQPDQSNHYFPADLPPPGAALRIVDGGAFNGDTIQMLLERRMPVDAVAAFEPDAVNFAQLVRRVGLAGEVLRDVTLFPCGLSSETVIRSFAAEAGSGSALQAGGGTHVQVVALDDVLPTFAPNFIKLDIEGAEPEALAGAARTIARFEPTLAVCVYHKPEHLWEIPRLVRQLAPRCRLALRYHQFNGFDVVLYAVSR